MDWTIFEVDHPVVLADDPSPIPVWDRMAPAPVLLIGLCGQPGTVVGELAATDGFLTVLAGVAGADAFALPAAGYGDALRHNALINDTGLAVVDALPERLDVLVAHSPHGVVDAVASRPVVLLTDGAADLPGYHRIDVIGTDIRISDPAVLAAAHLLVPQERVEHVVGWVDEAVHAFGGRTRNRWADRSTGSALRLAEHHRAEAERSEVEAQEQVQRAYSQMKGARDELQAVRNSRSWRLTRPLRKLHHL